MKRFFSAIVILILVFGVTACSVSTDVDDRETELTNTGRIDETFESESSEENFTEEDFSEKSTEEKKTKGKAENKETTTREHSVTSAETTTEKIVTTTKKPVTTTKKAQTTATPSKNLPAYSPETEMVYLFNKINNYRAENGLNKLALDTDLCKLAYLRALEQRTLKGHTRPDNTAYYTILEEFNYDYYGCGENIAFYRNVSSDEIFEKWKNSSAHNQNMMEKRWTKSGIAMCKNPDGTYTIVHLFAC